MRAIIARTHGRGCVLIPDGSRPDWTALHFLYVLAKVADRQLLGDRDRALVGSFLADHHPEERCLARPIGTDQSNFFARIQLKRSIHEEQLLAILLIDVRERDHFLGATGGMVPLPV